jgi:hypothetical protein
MLSKDEAEDQLKGYRSQIHELTNDLQRNFFTGREGTNFGNYRGLGTR